MGEAHDTNEVQDKQCSKLKVRNTEREEQLADALSKTELHSTARELQAKQSSILQETKNCFQKRMKKLDEQLAQTCVMRELQSKQHATLQGQILRLEEQLTAALSAKEDHLRQLGASHVQILALEQQ